MKKNLADKILNSIYSIIIYSLSVKTASEKIEDYDENGEEDRIINWQEVFATALKNMKAHLRSTCAGHPTTSVNKENFNVVINCK
jgi:hypothetical protein